MRRMVVCLAGLAMILAAGCHRRQSKAAVEEAIQGHLKRQSNLSLDKFTTEIQDIRFQGDTAEALVKFQSKQSSDLFVRLKYVLRKVGDHWEVQSRTQLREQQPTVSAPKGSEPTGMPPRSGTSPEPSH